MCGITRLSRHKLCRALLSLVLSLPALGMSNAAFAAYDFTKLEAATPLARLNSPTFGQVKFPQAGQSGL